MTSVSSGRGMAQRLRALLKKEQPPEIREQLVIWAAEFDGRHALARSRVQRGRAKLEPAAGAAD